PRQPCEPVFVLFQQGEVTSRRINSTSPNKSRPQRLLQILASPPTYFSRAFGFANGVVNVTRAAVARADGTSQPVLLCGIPQGRDTRRSSPLVGRKRRPEGSRMMMRKPSLILLGAAAGVAVTLIATPPRIVLDGARAQAAAADTYRQLSLFGDVFERVRADYVEKPDDSKLIESAINGMLAGLDPH